MSLVTTVTLIIVEDMENKVEAGLFLARIERKCDVIIGMLHDLAGNPDFLIESLRKSVESRETNPGSGWKYAAGMELEQTVVEQYQWILKLAKKYCRNTMDAEDLAGETICKILCNKGKFDSGRSFRPWCSVIMLNTYITSYNRNSSVRFESEERASSWPRREVRTTCFW